MSSPSPLTQPSPLTGIRPASAIDFIRTARKSQDWKDAQVISRPDECANPTSAEVRGKLSIPYKSHDWNDMDIKVSESFVKVVDIAKPDNPASELLLLKLTIYAEFETAFGTKTSSNNGKPRRTEKLSEEKKTLRRKKKDAKRGFKKMKKDASITPEMLSKKKSEWRQLIRTHNRIRLQELELQRKRDEIANNSRFTADPFKFMKNNVTKESSGKILEPSCDLQTAESFFEERYSDQYRTEKVNFPEFLDIPQRPSHPFIVSAPPAIVFENYIKSRRNKSSPGPDGIPYVIYKKCHNTRKLLIRLLQCIWNEGQIPYFEKLALKILLPKTTSTAIKDFRDITLFNTSLKALTGVWGRRLCEFMTKNSYIDTTLQKGFIPRIAGCIEHNQTLVTQIKEERNNKQTFQLAFLDLENAFGSVKHNLILAALKWYNVPQHLIDMIKSLYDNCFVIVKTSKWTTKAIQIQKGSLQGGPEAGVIFNVPWNLILSGLDRFLKCLGYSSIEKPIKAFADDANIKTTSVEHMQSALNYAAHLSKWSKSLRFKESKSAILAIDEHGKPVDPDIKLNGKKIPAFTNKPFKFLGKWIYPSLTDKDHMKGTVKRLEQLMYKTDSVPLDGRKKAWIYQHGILPTISWDFMMTDFNDTTITTMERCVNKYLKKWLNVTKSADPSILYRGTFGLSITSIRNAALTARTNTEITLCTSKDPNVRLTAKRRREKEHDTSLHNTPKRLKRAVNDLVFQAQFCQSTRTPGDRRGIGVKGTGNRVRVNKRSIIKRVKELSDEERIAKIMSLASQSQWTNWDDVVDTDWKWKEILYGLSSSMLSFWLNSVQNTLPDPVNLRRWGKQKTAQCPLCNWKNCTLQHILCSCKVALEQGRISWRHDSLLTNIVKHLKESKVKHDRTVQVCQSESNSIEFVKKGVKPKKRKKPHTCFWGQADDWKILMDTRQKQYHIPPEIASSNLRPDICIHSTKTKKVCFIELTSPAEENITSWRIKKTEKYLELLEEARANGFKAHCRTIEVGARGFVSKPSMNVFSLFGFNDKEKEKIRKNLSKTAIRCSHFIWINRESKSWSHPSRLFD